MLSALQLFRKLLRRPHQPFPPAPPSEKIGRDGEQEMAFGEIFAAAVYVDFGVLPFELWQGHRNARKTHDQNCQAERHEQDRITRVTVKRGEARTRGSTDWKRIDAMTDEEATANVRDDLDAQPLSEERLPR
jgi:hypothetical protein